MKYIVTLNIGSFHTNRKYTLRIVVRRPVALLHHGRNGMTSLNTSLSYSDMCFVSFREYILLKLGHELSKTEIL